MQHTGLEWGILTNGRLWRLYHKDTAHKLDRFYKVDLPALLQAGNIHNFLYFYAFFRRQAFDPGDGSIEAIRQASIEYARGVSDSLKTQVYEALRHVAQGFLDYQPNALQSDPRRSNGSTTMRSFSCIACFSFSMQKRATCCRFMSMQGMALITAWITSKETSDAISCWASHSHLELQSCGGS